MNTSIRLIPTALFAAELNAGFAELLELSAVSFIGARIKAACKTAGVPIAKLSNEELKELAQAAKEFILSKQYGKPYSTLSSEQLRKAKDVVKDALKRLDGSDKARQASKAKPEASKADGVISDMVPRDSVNNAPVNVAPVGDGKAALSALGSGTATDKRYAHMLELAILTKDSKDASARELSQMVRDMLGALM